MNEQEYKDKFQSHVDYAIDIYSDMVPYDDPEYEQEVMKMATSYANDEMNGYSPELEELCRQHDEWLVSGKLKNCVSNMMDSGYYRKSANTTKCC